MTETLKAIKKFIGEKEYSCVYNPSMEGVAQEIYNIKEAIYHLAGLIDSICEEKEYDEEEDQGH